MMTQEKDHTKWNEEINTSIILRSWLFLEVVQQRLAVTFQTSVTNYHPTLNNIQKSEDLIYTKVEAW